MIGWNCDRPTSGQWDTKAGQYPEAVEAVQAGVGTISRRRRRIAAPSWTSMSWDLKDPMTALGDPAGTPGHTRADGIPIGPSPSSRKVDLQLKGAERPRGARATLEQLAAEFPDSPTRPPGNQGWRIFRGDPWRAQRRNRFASRCRIMRNAWA